MERITSRKNPLLMKIRKLSSGSARARREAGEYLGDGVKLLEEALCWEAPLTTVVVTEGAQVPELPQGVRAIQVPQDVMETISPMNTPQGVLFLARLPETTLPERLEGRRYLVLDGVQDPGNVGTIWRTADALGADGLLLVNGCADPYGPKTGCGPRMGRLASGSRAVGGRAGRQRVRAVGAVRPAAVRHRSAGGYGLAGAGRSGPVRGDHRQRGPGCLPEPAGPQRPDHPHPHAEPL